MLVSQMNLEDLHVEFFDNAGLCQRIGGWDNITTKTESELREILTQWVFEGDECA